MIDQKLIDAEIKKAKFQAGVLEKDLSEFKIDYEELNQDDSEARVRSRKTVNDLIKLYGNDSAVRMCAYMNAILAWNEMVNLTGVDNRDDFLQKNIVDSLAVNKLEDMRGKPRVIDVGTGAGLPGVPLALSNPGSQFVLIDSVNKKLSIIREIVEDLSISNIQVVHGRAEDLGHQDDFREGFDVCVSRAVASLNVLAEWCLPFVKVGGLFVAYKGEKAQEEVDKAEKAIKTLGGELEDVIDVESEDPSMTMHKLVTIRKIRPTPAKYPRKAGMARKAPIR